MHRLLGVLGMPQRRFASVHVVGTNGKSSTARMVAALLGEEGLRAGAFTSPHIASFAERIQVGGEPVSDDELAAALGRALEAAERVEGTLEAGDRVTQFELLTAAAFHELARQGVEAAAIEAGLGGRWDATNTIPSAVQVLTSVALDHTRLLGDTPAEIARDKLGVVRDHATLVTPQGLDPEVEAVCAEIAAARHARRVVAAAETDMPLAARGAFQRRNFALACTAVQALLGRPLEPSAVRRAAARTVVPGRLEVVAERPLEVHDSAHNPEAAAALAATLGEAIGAREPVAVVSVLDDKDVAGILRPLAPLCRAMVATTCDHPRALTTGALAAAAREAGMNEIHEETDPLAAVALARRLASDDGAVVVTGSNYLLAHLRRPPGAPGSTI